MGKPGDVQIFSGGTQDKGLDTFNPDIGPAITWDEETVNITAGVRRGIGVRYGAAPLAGHADTEVTVAPRCNGLMASEAVATGAGLRDRELIFGIIPLTISEYDGAYPKKNRRFYAFLVGLDDSANVSLDVCLGSTLTGTVFKQSSDLRAGLMASSYKGESPLVRRHKTELLNLSTTGTPTALQAAQILRAVPTRYWTPYAQITVSGKRVPYQWMLADREGGAPTPSTAPNLNLWDIPMTSASAPTVLGGSPSEIITRQFPDENTRQIKIYCLDAAGFGIDIQYTKTITNINTGAVAEYNSTGLNYFNLTGSGKQGASNAFGLVSAALLNDPGSFTNSRHDAILVAGETPFAVIYQDWLKAASGMKPRWIDLTNPTCNPRPSLTLFADSGIIPTPSAWFTNIISNQFVQCGANTGIFEINVTYDIGFSFYNKLIDYETNVAYGSSYRPSLSFTALVFAGGGQSYFQQMQSVADHMPPWEYSETIAFAAGEIPRGFHINDYEIRFYFRERGTAEWLCCGVYDAAQYWFMNKWPTIGAGTGAVIGRSPQGLPPGGYPGGFIDYSPLPKQRYICALIYKGRAFWFSEKSLHFSNSNSIYAYATRNIFNVPTGVVRGGIVHIQPGEVDQTSRLVVFASDQSYVGRFTGIKLQQQVRVSNNTIGQFAVDGSDFEIDFLCDATAYSYRSAVVAEGLLYFWGPQGVYLDDGISQPQPITKHLDPEIKSYVNLARIDEVHAVYNKTTKEVIWFYPPKIADAEFPTYGLVYNTRSQNFYPVKFRAQVDSAQNIKIENDDTPDDIDGERVIVHLRASAAATVSRSFFYDDLCKAGEQGPGRELLCKTVSTPVAGTRRLTMAAGNLALTNIVVNDFVAIQNVEGYAPSITTAVDFIAKVTAVNAGASWIEIALPTGAVLPDATLTLPAAFPVYHMGASDAGEHGITWKAQTNYWLPDGVAQSWLWRYLYMLFKVSLWPAPLDLAARKIGTVISLAYRTLISSGTQTDTFSLSDNSAGHAQVHHPLGNDEVAAVGQAFKYGLSGIHIGQEWTLEYLEAHCTPEQGFTLKEFEG